MGSILKWLVAGVLESRDLRNLSGVNFWTSVEGRRPRAENHNLRKSAWVYIKGLPGEMVRLILTISPGKILFSGSRDELRLDHEDEFGGQESLKGIFDIVGRLVGAIQFVARMQVEKDLASTAEHVLVHRTRIP